MLVNRKALLESYQSVGDVVPTRSPKPVLQNVLLRVNGEGATLAATDLEVRVCVPVGLVRADDGDVPAVLLSARVRDILKVSTDEDIDLTVSDGQVTLAGVRSRYVLPTEDVDTYPEAPVSADADEPLCVPAELIASAIHRTSYACDVNSTRFALGGVAFLVEPDVLSLVATDGRRLAWQRIYCEGEATAGPWVVPLKALKLIARLGAGDSDPVRITFDANTARFVFAGGAVVMTRLVEGRFPAWKDVMPGDPPTIAFGLPAGELLRAINQASITTSEESRACDWTITPGLLKLTATAADVGKSVVEVPLEGVEASETFATDPRYVTDVLRSLSPTEVVTIEVRDRKRPVVFRAEPGLVAVVMPLTRDR